MLYLIYKFTAGFTNVIICFVYGYTQFIILTVNGCSPIL